MIDIKIGFWNLGNLFDAKATPIAADFEFTPSKGWTQEVLNKKLKTFPIICC
jgi:hypothetical protein